MDLAPTDRFPLACAVAIGPCRQHNRRQRERLPTILASPEELRFAQRAPHTFGGGRRRRDPNFREFRY